MLRDLAHRAAAWPPAEWLVSMLERLDGGRPDTLAVITYHRVFDASAASTAPRTGVSTAALAEHVEALAHRYEAVSMEDVLAARAGLRRLPPRALLFTFDDAYKEFEAFAWPILHSRGVPAAVFAPTAYPDQPGRWFWWDRLAAIVATAPGPVLTTPLGDMAVVSSADRRQALRRIRDHCKRIGVEAAVALVEDLAPPLGLGPAVNEVLGWGALRALARAGVHVAPHSRTHAILTHLPDADLDAELGGSRDDVMREIGGPANVLAYPSGAWDQRVLAAAAEAGYEVAFTTDRGVNDLRRTDSWLRLRRVNVGDHTSAVLLRAQAGRWMAIRGTW